MYKRQGLINSGGDSKGDSDLVEAVTTAVINKRAGGSGLILGRKAFQRPFNDGVDLLHTLQSCLLYTSDAADERSSVDLGGRRIIKKKTRKETRELKNMNINN